MTFQIRSISRMTDKSDIKVFKEIGLDLNHPYKPVDIEINSLEEFMKLLDKLSDPVVLSGTDIQIYNGYME